MSYHVNTIKLRSIPTFIAVSLQVVVVHAVLVQISGPRISSELEVPKFPCNKHLLVASKNRYKLIKLNLVSDSVKFIF